MAIHPKLADWWRSVTKGIDAGAAPGVACWVQRRGEVVLHDCHGLAAAKPEPDPVRLDMWWDLASLSKALSTTLCALKLAEDGRLPLDVPLGQSVPGPFAEDDRLAFITPRLLLTHTTGLPSWRRFYRTYQSRAEVREALLATNPTQPAGRGCVYSDLGFLLLGFAIEAAAGQRQDEFLEESILTPLGLSGRLRYGPLPPEDCAATEDCPWRGYIARGEVHDENCAACDGVSGHAGVFATAESVGLLLEAVMRRRLLTAETWNDCFTVREDVAAGRFWLGFKRLGYESGDETAFGHDGFTGTLGWVCPREELVVALLTNRVHPTRQNSLLYDYRPRWIADLAKLAGETW
ncbi:MAG TPA: esterase [Armatimonadetes bacterium]|nr:esterase [Armatimonadota bacterium]